MLRIEDKTDPKPLLFLTRTPWSTRRWGNVYDQKTHGLRNDPGLVLSSSVIQLRGCITRLNPHTSDQLRPTCPWLSYIRLLLKVPHCWRRAQESQMNRRSMRLSCQLGRWWDLTWIWCRPASCTFSQLRRWNSTTIDLDASVRNGSNYV